MWCALDYLFLSLQHVVSSMDRYTFRICYKDSNLNKHFVDGFKTQDEAQAGWDRNNDGDRRDARIEQIDNEGDGPCETYEVVAYLR